MRLFHPQRWLVASFLSQLLANAVNNSTINEAFPQLVNLAQYPTSYFRLFWGGQDMNHCCLLAVKQSLDVSPNGTLLGKNYPSFLVDDLETFRNGQFGCGANYIGDDGGAPVVNITYRFCADNCPGWQLSKASKLNQWVSPFVGFLVPALVFCLAIPRRRKLRVPEKFFDVALNEVTSSPFTPFIAVAASALVTIDTIIWLMTVFALAGPILVSGVYEASLDKRILEYTQEKIRNKLLTIDQRARLLYTILVGNLDITKVPKGESEDNTVLSHIDSLLQDLRHVVSDDTEDTTSHRPRAIAATKTRLRTMLATQYSFGVTVGGPVIFFCGSFVYTVRVSHRAPTTPEWQH
jgi:hypothetical protein